MTTAIARRPVYIRGVGAFTPLGDDWRSTADRLAAGECAIAPIRSFDASDFPCTVAAAIDDERLTADDRAFEDRRWPLARRAAREAWKMAGLRAAPDRIGVFVGAESGRGRWSTVLGLADAARGANGAFDHARFGTAARPFASRIDASMISPSAIAARLASELEAGGPVETISLACASGSAAIVEGARAVRLGVVDVALCGGVGADVDPLMLAGFGLLGILSARGISCPFDVQRDGFVIGEGAAFVALAADRGDSEIELAGIGRSLDGYHLTAPEPDGDGAIRAMTAALADAGHPSIGYVQAHGTSTPLNDRVEAAAIRRVLGDGVDRAWVSSSKGALGHWVAGAGALGVLYAWEAVARGRVLPTAGLVEPDAQCPVRHVVGRAAVGRIEAALANSFAFGGANSCTVLRRLT